VVLDYEMPEMKGDLVAEMIRRQKPSVPIVLFTGTPDHVPDRVPQNIDVVVYKTDFSGLLGALKHLVRDSRSKRHFS
jgi:CheY-like chemotaxis protein